MRRISDTIARLNAAAGRMPTQAGGYPSALVRLDDFGSNPGALTGWYFLPPATGEMPPLVVVLHGCTQNAAGYDRGSGWSALAERFGFAVLFAEQARGNNPNGCFNWFAAEDTRRGGGEAASIRQMIAAMTETYAIDPGRIFITGLSAGGAMTSAMLAAYPELFAGGAIIAGLPYGAATSTPQAFDRMRGHGHPSDDVYAEAVRNAAPRPVRWPDVAVWHGSADGTVGIVNADRIVGQWRVLHGLPVEPIVDDTIDGARHRVWQAADGPRIEEYRIPGMGHGTPLAVSGPTAAGSAMPYMLDVGISSTWHIARGWGLLDTERLAPDVPETRIEPPVATATSYAGSVQDTIEAALRSAGLMR